MFDFFFGSGAESGLHFHKSAFGGWTLVGFLHFFVHFLICFYYYLLFVIFYSGMFYKFEKATFLFFKKKFREISYISYTDTAKFLFLWAISGVGLGVGFPTRCRIILHLPPFFIPPLRRISASETRRNRAVSCQILGENAGISSKKRHQNQQNPTPILHPAPYPTPYPTPEIARFY